MPWRLASLIASKPLQAALTLTWTATALPLMLWATRRGLRPLWMIGAALLAVVVVKLFVLDLAALSGLPRVVAFLGVGVLLLVIGYFAPPPGARAAGRAGRAREPAAGQRRGDERGQHDARALAQREVGERARAASRADSPRRARAGRLRA